MLFSLFLYNSPPLLLSLYLCLCQPPSGPPFNLSLTQSLSIYLSISPTHTLTRSPLHCPTIYLFLLLSFNSNLTLHSSLYSSLSLSLSSFLFSLFFSSLSLLLSLSSFSLSLYTSLFPFHYFYLFHSFYFSLFASLSLYLSLFIPFY
jgi:hypothetical protein